MKRNIILLNLILIIINFCLTVDSSDSKIGVPVLLWSQTKNDLINNNIFDSISSQSSVNQINYNVLRDDYLLKSKTIVVFLQNDLSIEQFSTEDNNRFNTIKNIITDHSRQPLLLTDVLNPTEALKDFTPQDINQININNGYKTVIKLPKNSLVENDELIGELMAKIGQNVTQKVLYLITGRQNSNFDINDNKVEESEDSHRYGRHVLAEDIDYLAESPRNETDDKQRLINIGDCLYFFTSLLTVSHYNSSIGNTIGSFDPIHKPEINSTSRCWQIIPNNATQIEPAFIDMTFKNSSTGYPYIRIQLTIDSWHHRNKTDFWGMRDGIAYLQENSTSEELEYTLIVNEITSEYLFSYSCSKLIILSQIRNQSDIHPDRGLTQISLVFNNFQLQPFKSPHNKNQTDGKDTPFFIFTDSFDCETWMTLPLWMGLLTILMFFTILFIGIYFLSQVSTPDRFENPKGKPLMITNIDE